MNFKTTIVLIVLLAVVGAYLFITRSSDTESETISTSTDERKLIDIKSEDITKLSIAPAGGERIVIEKRDGNWRITEPVNAAADRYAVDSLVTDIAGLTSRGKVDVAETGEARYTVEVTTKEGKTHNLAVGERSAVGDHMYVRVDDAEMADVVPAASLYDALDKPLKDYRDTKLVAASSNEIQQIEIRDGERTIALQKQGDDWQITQPSAMPVDSSAASDLTFAITGLNAEDYVTENPEALGQYGLSDPVLSVWYSTEAPATQPSTAPATEPTGTTVSFGRYDDILKKNVFATVSGSTSVVKVPASTLDKFRKSPLELRDKAVVEIDPETVTTLSIKSDLPATTQPTTREAVQRTIVIHRQKEEIVTGAAEATTQPTTAPTTAEAPTTTQVVAKPTWTFAESTAEAKVDEEKVTTLLSALNPLQAEKYLEQAPTTQPVGSYVLTVTSEATLKGETSEISLTDPGNDQPLIGAYNGLTFELDRSLVEKLEGDFVEASSVEAEAPPTATDAHAHEH